MYKNNNNFQQFVNVADKKYKLSGEYLQPGMKAKDFTVFDFNLAKRKLSDFNGKSKLISVSLSIDTGVCSKQNLRFNNEAGKLSDKLKTISISVDLPFALKRFYDTNCMSNITMLSDYKLLDFGYKYGLVIEELRMLSRAIIFIDSDNIIRYTEYCKEVTNHLNYDKIFNFIKNWKF